MHKKTPKREKNNHAPNIALAIQSADAFRGLSKIFLTRVGTDMRVSHERAVHDLGGMIASATNMSLAVELYLKALRISNGLGATTNHDLGVLFDGLPPSIKDSVVREYGKLNSPPVNSTCAFELAIAPRIPQGQELKDLEARQPLQDSSLKAVLKRNRNTFQNWRYLHERGDSHQIITFVFEFYHLDCVATVLRMHAVNQMNSEQI